MSSNRLWHLFACTTAALLVTFGAVALDLQRTGVQQTQSGLTWARQVSSQAEGMVLKAKENREKNPLDWAIDYLSQGVEPRLIRIGQVHAPDNSQTPESYSLDHNTGMFDYTRIFTPEDGAGVHIQLTLGYVGFLGAKSALTSDLLGLVLFAMCFGIVFLRTGRHFGFDDTGQIRKLVSRWVGGAKSQLTQHGGHVREMVRQSQRLAACSGRSREIVGGLRDQIHEGLAELHSSRDFYKEGEIIAARAETLALNMAIESNRLGGDARRIADLATELHRRIQALHAVNRQGQALLQRIERKIEPWTTDADLAYHAFDDVRDATDLLGKHIRSTTESLISQAKLIQGLNIELGTSEAKPPIPVPPPSVQNHRATTEVTSTTALGARLPDPLPTLEESTKDSLFKKFRAKKSA